LQWVAGSHSSAPVLREAWAACAEYWRSADKPLGRLKGDDGDPAAAGADRGVVKIA